MYKTITWEKNDHIRFVGRNGSGFCCGVEVLEMTTCNPSYFTISPLTSKGDVARCSIDIPLADVPALIKALKAGLAEAKITGDGRGVR